MPKYVIIGNSAAGTAAAEAIRRRDAQGSIALLSEEPGPAYSRPRLTEFLSGSCSPEDLVFRPLRFYQQHRIELIYARAHRLRPETSELILEGGQKLRWERLLIATGGVPSLPEGLEIKEGVFTFNNLEDAQRIMEALKGGNRAVVIGAGLIGVSAAKGLVKRGAEVTLIARSQRILSTFLDGEASALAEAALREKGVRVITGSQGEAITGRAADGHRVGGVALGTGQEVPTDLVIVGRGVNPRTELAAGTPLRVEQGIVVDEHLATSLPGIYACGDVAQLPDAVSGQSSLSPNWPNATMGGKAAGLNMAGGSAAFAGIGFNSLNLLGFPIMAAGIAVPPENGYQSLVDRGKSSYRKLVLSEGRIVGMILAGDISRAGLLLELMRRGLPVHDFQESLLSPEFGFLSLPEEFRRHQLQAVRGGR